MLPAKQNLLNKSKLKFQQYSKFLIDANVYCLTPAPAPPVAEYEHNATAEQALCLQRFPSRLWYGQCKFNFDEPGASRL